MKRDARRTAARPARRGLGAALVLVSAVGGGLVSGCSGATNMRLGERAERQGRCHVAYTYYCDEAKVRPSSGAVQAAIARVAPRAARHCERQGTIAVDAGNYAQAWKWYMQALTISPDDTAIARLIRMLEEHHRKEIAPVKDAWMREGAVALATSPPDTKPASRENAGDAARVENERAPDVGTAVRTGHEGEARAEPAVRTASAEQPDAGSAVPRTANVAAPNHGPHQGAREDDETAGSQAVGSWLTSAVLSVEDRRFPREVHTVDDIRVKVKDTDPGPDADLDIYLGDKRIEKVRDIKTGESVRVKGRSGGWYELVVITIVDRTESVRIGIRRLRAKPD